MRKIAFGTTNLNYGLSHQGIDGIGIYCQELLHQFRNSSLEIEVVPFSYGKTSINQQNIQLPSYPIHLIQSYLRLNSLQLKRIFQNIDVVHSTDLLIPLMKEKKIVATVMDVIPMSHPNFTKSKIRNLKSAIWKNVAKRVDKIITCSEFSKEQIAYYFGYPLERITVTPLGVDEDYFVKKNTNEIVKVREKYNIPYKFFLYLCTLQPRKNIVKLLDAHRLFSQGKSEIIPIVLAGKLGWDDGDILSSIRNAQSEGRCIWVNYVSDYDKKCLLQGAVGVSFASLYEGFGLPVLEALASQTPIFASNTSSIPEVGGDCIKYIDPVSIDSMLEGFDYLMNSSLNQKNIDNGFSKAKEFTWKRTAKQTLSVYQEV